MFPTQLRFLPQTVICRVIYDGRAIKLRNFIGDRPINRPKSFTFPKENGRDLLIGNGNSGRWCCYLAEDEEIDENCVVKPT